MFFTVTATIIIKRSEDIYKYSDEKTNKKRTDQYITKTKIIPRHIDIQNLVKYIADKLKCICHYETTALLIAMISKTTVTARITNVISLGKIANKIGLLKYCFILSTRVVKSCPSD
jgi:hypothetical protein